MKIKYPNRPVIFIMGPTASGKTALAIDLYQTDLFEIISVDSAMIYKDMDIGSAKPDAKELSLAPHHLIDFLDPSQSYSAAQFSEDAIQLINEIHDKKRIPLLTGGTMLYFKALKEGLADLPEADESIRNDLKQKVKTKGIESLHHELAQCDPKAAEKLHATDTQRIMRALEVFLSSGKPLSQWHAEQKLNTLPNPLLSIALAPFDRAILHQRIADRFQQMMNNGFFDEVKRLYAREDLHLDLPSMRSVGYRQMWQHLNGELSYDEAIERAIIATRQLAKRQYTWLRSWQDIHWFDSLDNKSLEDAKQTIFAFIKK